MRTTLTLEPDVAIKIRQTMAEKKTTLKEVINQTLRAGFKQPAPKKKYTFRVEPHDFGFKPGIDLDKMNQLLDELEVEEFAKKYRP
ncbi:MAG: antitoxin [Bryobacteraceae bacterium]